MCDRIAVMQSGRIVELTDVDDMRAMHASDPYTRQLLESSRGYTRES